MLKEIIYFHNLNY